MSTSNCVLVILRWNFSFPIMSTDDLNGRGGGMHVTWMDTYRGATATSVLILRNVIAYAVVCFSLGCGF